MGLEPMTSFLPRMRTTSCAISAIENGGQSWIRTNEGISQEIYSLPRLTASVSTLIEMGWPMGFEPTTPRSTI